jgi:hypothetical protein
LTIRGIPLLGGGKKGLPSWTRADTIKQAAWVSHGALKWPPWPLWRGASFVWFEVKSTTSFMVEPLLWITYFYHPHTQIKLPSICRLWPCRRLAATAVRCRTARTYDAPCIRFVSGTGIRIAIRLRQRNSWLFCK